VNRSRFISPNNTQKATNNRNDRLPPKTIGATKGLYKNIKVYNDTKSKIQQKFQQNTLFYKKLPVASCKKLTVAEHNGSLKILLYRLYIRSFFVPQEPFEMASRERRVFFPSRISLSIIAEQISISSADK